MKKLLTAVILAGLVLMFTLSATAEPKIYVDYLLSGSGENKLDMDLYSGGVLVSSDTQTSKSDLSGTIIGFEVPFGRFKIAGDYGVNLEFQDKDTKDKSDLSLTNIKAGYCLIDNDRFLLNGIVGSTIMNVKDDSGNETEINGIQVGLDGVYYLSERASIEGSIDQSVSTTASVSGVDDSNIDSAGFTEYKLKFNYLFTEKLGASLGYMAVNSSIKAGDSVNFNAKETMNLSTITLGIYYRF
jgi:hypothetical protein